MKKYLLLFWVAMTSIYALAADYHSLEEIRDQWRSRNIKVPQGGQNPNIVQLLSAFQNAWGAYMVDEVLECAKAPRFTSKKDEELNIEIIVDRKNGYACLDNGGTDSGYMETCMWRRDNIGGLPLHQLCLPQGQLCVANDNGISHRGQSERCSKDYRGRLGGHRRRGCPQENQFSGAAYPAKAGMEGSENKRQ